MNGCTETLDVVSRRCRCFRESGRFNSIPSDHKIGTILNLDAKTVWTGFSGSAWRPGDGHAYPLNIWTQLLLPHSRSSMQANPPP
jgi:hypothetical protein